MGQGVRDSAVPRDKLFVTTKIPAETKTAAGARESIRESMRLLKDGEKLCIFPEGTRNKTGEDLEGKAGAAMIAARMHVPVVPTRIDNSRKFFRIVHVTFGEPMYIDQAPRGAGNEAYHEAAQRIMDTIKTL